MDPRNKLSIVLGLYNSDGLYASIENGEQSDLDIHLTPHKKNVEQICRSSANKLRLLAKAFDILATMDDPLKPVNQRAAMKAAKQALSGGD